MVHEKGVVPEHIIHTPVWVTIIRGIQFFLAIVILGISAWLIHGAYIEELGFAIAVSLFTWIIVPYVLFTEKLPGLHSLYHIIAVLVLEGWMVIMWLACFASVAARRAKFVVPTTVDNCFSDGSLVGSHYCTEVRKREILKREVLLFKGGQAGMSAAAGLGALCWLLFVATFVYTMVMFFRARKEGRFVDVLNGGSGGHHDPETAAAAAAAGTGSYQMEPKPYDGAGAPTHNQGPYYAQVPHGGQEHHGQVPHGHQAPYNAQVPYSPQEVSPPQSFSPPPAGSYPPYQPSVSPQPTIPSQHGQELHAQPYGYQNQPAQQQQQQQQYYSSPPVHHHAPVTRNELPSNSHHVTSSAPRASSPVRSSSPGYSGGNSNNNSSSNDNNYSSY